MGTAMRGSNTVIGVDALIPSAVKEADLACERIYGPQQSAWCTWYWDRTFHAAMDRLACAAGLRTKVKLWQ